MNELYLWIVTAVTAAVAVNTLFRLWADRSRLWRDDLGDEDRLFAWRIVIFLIYPMMTLVDLRATVVGSQILGGYVDKWSYGLFWYTAYPQGLTTSEQMVAVLFAGALVQLILAVCLMPSLFFRPHPFLATIIGYTIATVLGANLIFEPLLSLLGVGGSRWQVMMHLQDQPLKLTIFAIYGVLAVLYLVAMMSEKTRLWFADLSQPLVTEQLRDVIAQWRHEPENPHICSKLALLYERAGLRDKALRSFKRLKSDYPRSIYAAFMEGILSYRQRKYDQARKAFLLASDFPYLDAQLKASLLAASACAAFADGDMEGALNLSERSLEFDDASLVARMVKVDVFLRTERKEQAGEEIIAAIRRGLDLDLESKVPLDAERALQKIGKLQTVAEKRPHSSLRS